VREHNLSGKSHTALVNLIRNQGPDLVRAAQSNSLRGPKASGDTVETMAKMMGSKWSTSRSFPAGDAVYHCTRTDLTFLVQCMFTDPRFKGALRSSPPPLDYPIPSECATAPIFCQVAREAYAKAMAEWNAVDAPSGLFINPLHRALHARFGKDYHILYLPIFLQLFVDGVACSKALRVNVINFLWRVCNFCPELFHSQESFLPGGAGVRVLPPGGSPC
jgi:hypothetical protein